MSKLSYADNKMEAFQVLLLEEDAASQQTVPFTATSAYSANFEADTSIIELFSSQDCFVRLVRSTSSSLAVVGLIDASKAPSVFVPGGITKFFGIPRVEGVLWKLAVVRKTVSGFISITEGA